ncbi:hypothetical protein ACFSM7_12815 [Clavibacter michiganensis subsp. tessellarius]
MLGSVYPRAVDPPRRGSRWICSGEGAGLTGARAAPPPESTTTDGIRP